MGKKGLNKWLLGAGVLAGYWGWQKMVAAQGSGAFLGAGRGDNGTAVVTGASSGIGEAFVRELAKGRYDVVLVARREEKLCRLASELSQTYGVLAEVVVADLSTPEGVERVEEMMGQLDDLRLLVNNAGFGSYGPLMEMGLYKQLDMIHVHVNATMRLTRAALTKMHGYGRGFGGVINVSSIAGFFHGANSANYCATKAYINSFSQAIQEEVSTSGLFVQSLCPGYTYTEFHDSGEYDKFSRSDVPQWLWMRSDEVAQQSLAALGNGEVVFIPGWYNRVIVKMAQLNISMSGLRSLAKKISGK